MYKYILIICSLIASPNTLFASELMHSASNLESGKLGVSVYSTFVENDLNLEITSSDLIQVPIQGGGNAQFFSDSNKEVEIEGEGRSTIAVFTLRPWDGLHYSLKLGLGNNYEVKVPSVSVKNELSNSSQGFIWGLGARWMLVSHSPVTPAVSIEFGYTQSIYDFDRFQSGSDAASKVDYKFMIDEIQAALTVSKRFKRVEPYGGLKLIRQTTTLRDNVTLENAKGVSDVYAPFLGVQWQLFQKEKLNLEASIGDETLIAFGLNIGF